jgi:hypothetical protein
MRLRSRATDAKVTEEKLGKNGGDEKQIGKDGRRAEEWCREVFCFGSEPAHAKQGASK